MKIKPFFRFTQCFPEILDHLLECVSFRKKWKNEAYEDGGGRGQNPVIGFEVIN